MSKGANKPAGTEYIALPKGAIEDGQYDEADLTDEELAFDEFRTGLGAEKMGELRVGKLKLAKDGSPLANARSAHCFSCPIDQYNFSELLEYIRTRHGSGLYRVVGIESGRKGVAFNKIIEIAEDRGPKTGPQENPLQNPANIMESVGRIMAESQARTEALIARLTESRAAQAPAPDPMDSMTKMAAVMSTLMQGIAGRPVQSGGDILDQVEKLLKLKELLGGGGSGNDSGAESNFFDVVKVGLQSFAPALSALAVKGMQQPGSLPAPPITVEQPASIPGHGPVPNYQKPTPTRQAGDTSMTNYKRQVDQLVTNAKNGVDPMQLAGMILDLTPDEKLDDLEAMVQAPDMIPKMALLNSEVNTYRDFFEKLRTALLTLLQETAEDTLGPGDGSHNADQPPGNASTT